MEKVYLECIHSLETYLFGFYPIIEIEESIVNTADKGPVACCKLQSNKRQMLKSNYTNTCYQSSRTVKVWESTGTVTRSKFKQRAMVPVQESPKGSVHGKSPSNGTGTNPFYSTGCNISSLNGMFKPVTYIHSISWFQLGHVSRNEPFLPKLLLVMVFYHSNKNPDENSILWIHFRIFWLLSGLGQYFHFLQTFKYINYSYSIVLAFQVNT